MASQTTFDKARPLLFEKKVRIFLKAKDFHLDFGRDNQALTNPLRSSML
jgi:hypothetical protein